ncbi:MAG: beta-galactosidase, partial [Porphyromonas sp.]|nr:beta-galactosidase [Porphyromonas sp.]
MKHLRLCVLGLGLTLGISPLLAQRSHETLKEGWRFTRQDEPNAMLPSYNDQKWQSVVIPHDWAIYGPFGIDNDKQNLAIAQDGQKQAMEHAGRTGGLPFVGVGWYRTNFQL